MAGVVSFEEALRIVEEHAASVRASEVELVDLQAARGRVLAEAIVADRDFPSFDRATRDGYAVQAADVGQVPVQLEVVGEIKAGQGLERSSLTVRGGQAVSIMTGAPLPAGADAVVMVEDTAASGNSVEIKKSSKSERISFRRAQKHARTRFWWKKAGGWIMR